MASLSKPMQWAFAAASVLALAACQADELANGSNRHLLPLSYAAQSRLQNLGMRQDAPIMMRIYKQEGELEIWKQGHSGKFQLFKTYEICRWSGELGPKFKEGDRQAPEGFYEITPALMNPKSDYYLSFNLGFPNPYDQAHERTGSHLMVHGACSSRGCYAMTDEQMQEIYAMAREAFRGGQKSFQVQAFPFRMTAENFVQHRDSPHLPFWKMLKEGHDHFEVAKAPPKLDYCGRRYVFNAVPDEADARFVATRDCPAYTVPDYLAGPVAQLDAEHDGKVAAMIEKIERKQARAEKREELGRKMTELLSAGKEEDAGETAEAVEAGATSGQEPIEQGSADPANETPLPQAAPGQAAEAANEPAKEPVPADGDPGIWNRTSAAFGKFTSFLPGVGRSEEE